MGFTDLPDASLLRHEFIRRNWKKKRTGKVPRRFLRDFCDRFRTEGRAWVTWRKGFDNRRRYRLARPRSKTWLTQAEWEVFVRQLWMESYRLHPSPNEAVVMIH